MRIAIVSAAIFLAAIVGANAQVQSCNQAYNDCLRKLGPSYQKQCRASLAQARKTGIFIGPQTGRQYRCQ